MPQRHLSLIMRKRSFGAALLTLFFLSLPLLQAKAGVVIGGTRFVYPEREKSISFSVRNPSDESYLIYTKVEPGGLWTGADIPHGLQSTFVAMPQLFSLHPERENTVRLIFTSGDVPADRETLFTLNVAAIPSANHDVSGVQTAVRSRFKLFYRPAGLAGKPDDAYQALHWSRSKNKVVVNNPTPYYVTLYQLSLGGKSIPDGGVVAPFSERLLDGCITPGLCEVRWQTINDFGRIMPVRTQTVAS